MNKQILANTMEIIKNFLDFLYLQPSKKYFIHISWYENNLTIIINDSLEETNILHYTTSGTIDIYHFIIKKIIKLIINNDLKAFGYLSTSNINNRREIKSGKIRTNNLEFELPIYSNYELELIENMNSVMLDNLKKKEKQKILIK